MIPVLGTVPWKLVGVGLAGIAIIAFSLHYRSVLSDREEKAVRIAQLETATEAQARGIQAWKTRSDSLETLLAVLSEVSESAGEEGDRLNELFSRHDLLTLTLAKPGLMENRINAGSSRILGMLREATADSSRDR